MTNCVPFCLNRLFLRSLLAISIILTALMLVVYLSLTNVAHSGQKLTLYQTTITNHLGAYGDNNCNSTDATKRNVINILQPSCSMKIVVRGYNLYFRDVIPRDRTIWCPQVSCNVSLIYSSKLSDVLSANVTFFSHLSRLPPKRNLSFLVKNRRPNQRWALMSFETPLRVARNTTLPSGFGKSFHHWLATYDHASDIPFPYGRIKKLNLASPTPQPFSYFKSKSKMVAFVSSNCIHTKWRRLDFVHTLQKYVSVDIYGKCGNLTCNVDGNCTDILRHYKFILALENSPCPGYITEKFWNAIWKFQSVAIAWGAERVDYIESAPPMSYLYLEDFSSIEILGRRIKEISESEALYNQYHQWRSNYQVELQGNQETLPNNEHLCKTADRYMADMTKLEEPLNKKKTRFKDTNGQDWIRSCRIPIHTQMKHFPISET